MKEKRGKNLIRKKLNYHIGKLSEKSQLRLDFKDGISRPVSERIELGFISIEIPIINDVVYRVFDTMEDYRKWANKNLPKWLGYSTQ